MIQAPSPTTYVVVCRGPHCREKGSRTLRQRLVHLLRPVPRAQLVGYSCFGQCERGPNVAFVPPGEWYGGLASADAAERVVQHAVLGRPLDSTPLDLPADERQLHLRNIGELITTLERDRRAAATRRWWWPFSGR